jgi:two-component system response regulator CpxR
MRPDSAEPRGKVLTQHQVGSLQTSKPARLAHRPRAATRRLRQKRDRMRPKKTILCVDDNEQVLSVRTFLLETRGYRVIAANNAQEAIEVLERSLPGSLDLILCDLLMPQMDGNELVRRAKQLHPGLPAMIVSGTVNAFDRAVHADVFLPKGASSPAEMIERIRVLVARKRGPKKAMPASSPSHDTQLAAFTHATAS